ncbi:helix-turn-helix domain-containing protein [Nocardia cyriacigeorgica]|uniref:helix-turn-helix domain-containing protein n=1 Tax=Nocardia cyriacigeorgica TaxID=135487 RepID=UPI0024589A26|nr:helix-turn-helix transcriptional regulator [Nocardia cyriacigeorgica]
MSETGSTLPRRQLGRYLRDLRLQTGMTIPEAARRIERGASTLQRLETGQAERIRLLDVRELCSIFNASDTETEGLLGLAQQAAVKSWWHEFGNLIPANFDVYMGLESAAKSLTCYAPDVVLGLLQTGDYARTLLRSALPDEDSDAIDQRVQLKMKRQGLVTRKSQPATLNVVLLECAIRRVVGSPRIMAAQLKHIADMSTRPNVTVRILPFSAGIPLGDPMGPFTIVDFPADNRGKVVEPSVVYLESFTGDMYLEKPDDVRSYHEAHQALVRAALDEASSRTLLRQVARELVR